MNSLRIQDLSGKHVLLVSELTIAELGRAPDEVREILEKVPSHCINATITTEEGRNLARAYVEHQILSANMFNDALHIALATVEKADVLVSWNFKHIVNIRRIRMVNGVNLIMGYQSLEIRTPKEVIAIV